VYNQIGRGVPPATDIPVQGDVPESIRELWSMLEKCWDVDPDMRPSALEMQEFVKTRGDDLRTAFGEAFSNVLE
jgi:hypothetical protein